MREVLARFESGRVLWISSSALETELAAIPNPEKRSYSLGLLARAGERVEFTAGVTARAVHFQQFGLGLFDALHLASAEAGRCDVLLTTDDRFLKRSERVSTGVRLHNPVDWLRGTVDE